VHAVADEARRALATTTGVVTDVGGVKASIVEAVADARFVGGHPMAGSEQEEHRALLRLAAGGFRDMTRIASGHPGIWPDICTDNRVAIVGVLDDLGAALGEMRDLVAAGDRAGLLDRLDKARAARVNLPARFRTAADLREVRIPVPDRPGVVADVAILAADLDVNIVDLEIAHSTEGPQGVLVMLIESGSVDVFRAGLVGRGYRPAVLPVDVG